MRISTDLWFEKASTKAEAVVQDPEDRKLLNPETYDLIHAVDYPHMAASGIYGDYVEIEAFQQLGDRFLMAWELIKTMESNNPETPDGSPRDCDTCRWEGRSLLCCDCRDYAHWQPVPSPSEENPSPMTMAEIRIAMQDQCKETQSLRSQLALKDEGMREALEEAAQSLEALAGLAGKDETMLEYDQVRGYALNRAMAARAALREPAPVASHDASDTIRNAGSVSHDNREPDGRMGGVR